MHEERNKAVEKYKKALTQRAQLLKDHGFISIKTENSKKIEIFLDPNIFWLDDAKSIALFMRRFSKAYQDKPKLKELKLKVKGKRRLISIDEIKFNGYIIDVDHHFLVKDIH